MVSGGKIAFNSPFPDDDEPSASGAQTGPVHVVDSETVQRQLQKLETSTEPALAVHTQIRLELQFAELALASPSAVKIDAVLKQIRSVLYREYLVLETKKELLKATMEHLLSLRGKFVKSETDNGIPHQINYFGTRNTGTIHKNLDLINTNELTRLTLKKKHQTNSRQIEN